MINEETVLEDGETLGSGSAYFEDQYVVKYSGNLYPFKGDHMLNPLDPVNLILSWGILEGDGFEDDEFERVLNTMAAVSRFRKAKFSVVTKYSSGAVRTIKLENGSDKVVILGDYAKEHRLILPILSTQLSSAYAQEGIPLWGKLGFTTPPHYGICSADSSYDVSGWRGASLLDGSEEVTYWNIIGGGKKITVKKVKRDVEEQSISQDDDRDWDYGCDESVYYGIKVSDIEQKPSLTSAPFKKTTPQYVWQDKGGQDA